MCCRRVDARTMELGRRAVGVGTSRHRGLEVRCRCSDVEAWKYQDLEVVSYKVLSHGNRAKVKRLRSRYCKLRRYRVIEVRRYGCPEA